METTTPSRAPAPGPPPPPERAEPQRLHPISLLFGMASALRPFVIPFVAIALLSGQRFAAFFLVASLVPALIGSVLRYVFYRYSLGESEIVVREGIVSRNERAIPYARIQNIDLVQNPFHRLFGVAVVRLETASGGGAEAVIRVLSLDAVAAIRHRVLEAKSERAGVVEEGEGLDEERAREADAPVLLRLGAGELVLHGLVANRGGAVVAAALGVLSQTGIFDELPQRIGERIADVVPGVEQAAGQLPWQSVALMLLAAFVGIIVLLRVLSVAWAFVRFHRFTLRNLGEDLRVEFGLFNRVTMTIPRRRIQRLVVRQTRLEALAGRVALFVDTAGGAGGNNEEAGSTERLWLAPILPAQLVDGLVDNVLPEASMQELDWRPLAPGTARRLARRLSVIVLLAAAASALGIGWWALLVGALGVAGVLLYARAFARFAAWAEGDEALFARRGVFTRHFSAVRRSKIQSARLRESPFDRRWKMAHVEVDTAGTSGIGYGLEVPFLEAVRAREFVESLHSDTAQRSFRW